MPKWIVTVPIYGCADVFVEAEDEASAIAKAKEGDWTSEPDIQTWEVSDGCKGSVCGRTEHDDFSAFPE